MTPPLDILTPAGQESLLQERQAIDALIRARPRLRWVETDKATPARFDGFLHLRRGQSDVLAAIVEVKCRNLSLDTLRDQYENRWLITANKIADGITTAKMLGAPFIGLLHLVPDGLLLVQKITHTDGTPAVDIRYETTTTQATINGGEAIRLNAFVDMSQASHYTI